MTNVPEISFQPFGCPNNIIEMLVGTVVELPVVGHGLVLRGKDVILLAKLVHGRGIDVGIEDLRVPTDFVLVSATQTQMKSLGRSPQSIKIGEALARSKSKRPHRAVSIQSNLTLRNIESRVHSKTKGCPVLISTGAIVRGFVADATIYALVLKQDGMSLICVHLVENARVPVWGTYGILEENVVGILLRTATQVALTDATVKIAKGILMANGESKKTQRPECANCASQEDELSLCGTCKLVMYCTKACQRQHWKHSHKLACVPVGQRGRLALPPRTADACPICLETMDTAFTLSCGHKIHAACRDSYFRISQDARCPLCRKLPTTF